MCLKCLGDKRDPASPVSVSYSQPDFSVTNDLSREGRVKLVLKMQCSWGLHASVCLVKSFFGVFLITGHYDHRLREYSL